MSTDNKGNLMYRIMTNATANNKRIWCKKGFFPYGIAICIDLKTNAQYCAIRWD